MRLVTEGYTTMGELEHLSIDDVELGNQALDAIIDAKIRASEDLT